MTKLLVDPSLRKYALTEAQKRNIDAANETGSFRRAAKLLGLTSDAVRLSIRKLEIDAAARGWDPNGHRDAGLLAPFVMKGFTRQRNLVTGEDIQQWDKVDVDKQLRLQALMALFEAQASSLPRLPPVRPPAFCRGSLLNLYTFTDYHLGMRAWGRESGQDWDLAKAEALLVSAFTYMVANAPRAKVGFINQLGDFMHSDGLLPVTPTSGHVLDQGATYGEMVEAAVRVLRRLVDMALHHHEEVIVLMAEGNHDLASSVWLRTLFKALYEKEPRVKVIDTAHPFYAYQWGNVMLGFHHGHKVKNEALPGLFSARYRLMWGTCTKVYIHAGHRHHVDEKEFNGAKVIQHPTLAASDSHSAREGYESIQEATVITYHRKHGQTGRVTVTPEMLDDAA